MNLKDITQYVSDLSDKQRNKYQFLLNEKIISFKEKIVVEENRIKSYNKRIEEIYFNIANNINSDLDVGALLNFNNQISMYKGKTKSRLYSIENLKNDIQFLNDILDIINFKENHNSNIIFKGIDIKEISGGIKKLRKQQEIIDELFDLGVSHQIIKGDEVEFWNITVIKEFKKYNAKFEQLDYNHFYVAKSHLVKGLDHVEKIFVLLWELFQHNVHNKSLESNPILWCLNSFNLYLRSGDLHVYINDNDPLSPYVFHKETHSYFNRKGISILN